MEETNAQEGKGQRTIKFWAGFILGFLIVALFFSLSLPCKSKQLSKEAICGASLNGIGKGVVFYARENNDLYPPDLATLVQAGNVPSGMLLCPSSGTERATTTRPADIEAHCDYIYVSGFDSNPSGDLIRAFELPANHGQEFVNVLYVDFHVKGTKDMNVFAGELQRLNDYIAEERGAER